jgi:hypothetical protein
MSLSDEKQLTEQIQKNVKLLAERTAKGMQYNKEEMNGLKEFIKSQNESLEKYKQSGTAQKDQIKAMEETLAKSQELYNKLRDQYTAVGMITQGIASMGTEFRKFSVNSAAQMELAEEMAKTYKVLGKNIGMTGKNSEQLVSSFKKALPLALEMGMSQDELASVYSTISEATGRISTLTAKDAERIAGMAQSMNLSATQAAEMGESFQLMGVQTDKMEEHILETYKSAQSMGLNATKVIKVLQQNMKSMQSYSFAGGVKGMTSMAKQAVKMRLDVSDVLQMADKFYQPEAAIEAAANLQMLGGDIAEAFGDPFETMYLARNKPEELAKKLGDMTENMMQFNESTGEYEFPAEVRMQLKSAGEQLGINTEKMIEMARQTSKIKDIKMKFSSIGDDDMRENLASLAKYSEESGTFVVEHNGEELGLDSITDGMAEEIMMENQSSDKNLSDIAINTQTLTEQMQNFTAGKKAGIAGLTNIYELTAGDVAPMLKNMKEGVGKLSNTIIKHGEDMVKDMFKDQKGGEGIVGDVMTEMSNLGGKIKSGITSFTELNKATEKLKATINQTGDGKAKTENVVEDMASLPGSGGRVLSGEFGSLSLDDRDLVMAGDPKKLIGGGDEKGTSSEMKVSGTATINVNINSNTAISANMESQLTSKIIEVYQKISNGDGDPSSVFQAQPSKGSDILYT